MTLQWVLSVIKKSAFYFNPFKTWPLPSINIYFTIILTSVSKILMLYRVRFLSKICLVLFKHSIISPGQEKNLVSVVVTPDLCSLTRGQELRTATLCNFHTFSLACFNRQFLLRNKIMCRLKPDIRLLCIAPPRLNTHENRWTEVTYRLTLVNRGHSCHPR
jgi:hypothetical protein